MGVNFYMKRDGVDNAYIDIEQRFKGMKYMQCEGLEDKGKVKNIYIETYADSNSLRVHLPNAIAREATNIKFTFVFFGDNRQKTYEDFDSFINNRKIYYYDTKRLKRAYMIYQNNTEPKEDIYKGSMPFMIVEYIFQNMLGECISVDNSGTVPDNPEV